MKTVSVTELKNRLSYFLRLVKRGETIEILERSLPVARLQGVGSKSSGEAHLKRLIRDGIVMQGKRLDPEKILKHPPLPCSADPVKALIEERGNR